MFSRTRTEDDTLKPVAHTVEAAAPSREHVLDALRGFAIIFAIVEHYIAFLQVWYAGYFKEYRFIDGAFAVFKPRIGQVLAMDETCHALAVALIPWLSQLYIFLAAANLARRERKDFAAVYPRKMRLFAVLFAAFTIEQMILARDFGEMLLFGPTQLWCLLLAVIATLYRFGGAWPVAALFALAWLRFLLPSAPLEAAAQRWVATNIHPSVLIDAWPDIFLPAATGGFLFTILMKRRRATVPLAVAALLGIVWYKATRPPYYVPYDRVFATEHLVTGHAAGQAGVLGMLVLLTLAAGLLDKTRLNRPWPLLSWAGREILPLYLVHKIYFVFFYMPLRDVIAARTGNLPVLSIYEIAAAVASVLVFLYVAQKARLFDLLGGKAHA